MPQQQLSSSIRVTLPPAAAGAVPINGIIIWPNAIALIPANWALCDGTNGTPDLQSRFVRGVPAAGVVRAIGGALTHTHGPGTYAMPSHRHSLAGAYSDSCVVGILFAVAPWTGFTGPLPITGVSAANGNLPPYMDLYYIMRIL